jgi:hypothetical protein
MANNPFGIMGGHGLLWKDFNDIIIMRSNILITIKFSERSILPSMEDVDKVQPTLCKGPS